MLFLFLLC